MAQDIKLPDAARRLGITNKTLKRWMAGEFGYVVPRLGKGRQTVYIPEWMIKRLLEKHSVGPAFRKR